MDAQHLEQVANEQQIPARAQPVQHNEQQLENCFSRRRVTTRRRRWWWSRQRTRRGTVRTRTGRGRQGGRGGMRQGGETSLGILLSTQQSLGPGLLILRTHPLPPPRPPQPSACQHLCFCDVARAGGSFTNPLCKIWASGCGAEKECLMLCFRFAPVCSCIERRCDGSQTKTFRSAGINYSL